MHERRHMLPIKITFHGISLCFDVNKIWRRAKKTKRTNYDEQLFIKGKEENTKRWRQTKVIPHFHTANKQIKEEKYQKWANSKAGKKARKLQNKEEDSGSDWAEPTMIFDGKPRRISLMPQSITEFHHQRSFNCSFYAKSL